LVSDQGGFLPEPKLRNYDDNRIRKLFDNFAIGV
jgi:hypothetical protein